MLANYIHYDAEQGFRRTRWPLLILFLFILFFSQMFLSVFQHSFESADVSVKETSLGDTLLYLFSGNRAYRPNYDSLLVIPPVWLLMQSWLHFIVGFYPMRDLYSYGQQVFTRMNRRENWWISKYLWCLETILLAYLVILLSAGLVAVLNRQALHLELKESVLLTMHQISVSAAPSILQCFLMEFGFPLIVSMTISVIQLSVSLYVGPLYSYILIVSYLYLSIYFTHPLLIGNFASALRNRFIVASPTESVDPLLCLPICALMSFTAWITGWMKIRTYDILNTVPEE